MAEKYRSFAVGDWLVQPDINQVSTTTETIYLRPKLMEVLVYLAEQKGQVATLESIHDDLWRGKFVSSGTIYNCIADLRQALAKDGQKREYIETIPKKGYRLAPPVVAVPAPPDTEPGNVSVAILPLTNRARDADVEYLCVGIAEEILHRLSKVEGLKVFSALSLKDEGLEPRVVGLRFSTQMVLTGSLQKSGQKLRITFRLDHVSDGETIWSNRYDQEISDVFHLQDTVAQQVVGAMSPFLESQSSEAPDLGQTGTNNLEAFNAFLLGRHALSKMTVQGYDEAIRYFEQAVNIDPTFARAHYRLYLASYLKRRYYGEDPESLEKARIAAANAKKYGYKPAVPWIHIQRRLYRETLPCTRDLAIEAIDKIRNYDPEWGSFGYEQLTWILPQSGYFKATLKFAKRMLDSPAHNFEDSDVNEELPHYYAATGDYEEAIHLWSSEIQRDPARPLFRFERSLLYSRTGQLEYAQRDIDALGENCYLHLAMAFDYFWRQELDRIAKYHDTLRRLPGTHPAYLIWTYSMLGDFDAALEHYVQAVNSASHSFIDFGNVRAMSRAKLPNSIVRRLEGHPRFHALLEQQGIDDEWRAELLQRINDISDITGIHVSADEDG